jgi:putative transposase
MDAESWKRHVMERLDEVAIQDVRRHTRTGRPLGSDTFLSKLEARLGRRLRPLSPGRPKGWRKAKGKDAGKNKR